MKKREYLRVKNKLLNCEPESREIITCHSINAAKKLSRDIQLKRGGLGAGAVAVYKP